jgi:hypothetical protein
MKLSLKQHIRIFNDLLRIPSSSIGDHFLLIFSIIDDIFRAARRVFRRAIQAAGRCASAFHLERRMKGFSNCTRLNGFGGIPQSDFMAHLEVRIDPHPGASFARRGALAALLALTPAFVTAADAAPLGEVHRPPVPAAPLAIQPLEGLRASRERPLFSPTRRPPPPPPVAERRPEPPAPPPPPPNIALYAVVVDGDEARAVVRAAPGADVVRVRAGDDIGGWTVARIETQRLVLSLDGRLATFTMFAGNSRGDGPAAGPSSPSPDPASQFQPARSRSLSDRSTPPGAATPRGRRQYP